MTAVGFEPTHPKIVELESTALDHSATLSCLLRSTSFRVPIVCLSQWDNDVHSGLNRAIVYNFTAQELSCSAAFPRISSKTESAQAPSR